MEEGDGIFEGDSTPIDGTEQKATDELVGPLEGMEHDLQVALS